MGQSDRGFKLNCIGLTYGSYLEDRYFNRISAELAKLEDAAQMRLAGRGLGGPATYRAGLDEAPDRDVWHTGKPCTFDE